MNPVEIAALDALDLLVVVDNESDTLSSVDKGVPQLPELGRLVARVFPIVRPSTVMTASSHGGICASPATASRRWSRGDAAPKSARSSSTSDPPPTSGLFENNFAICASWRAAA